MERLLRLEDRIDPARLRAHAERFGRPRFEQAYRAFVEARLRERGSAAHRPVPAPVESQAYGDAGSPSAAWTAGFPSSGRSRAPARRSNA